MDINSSTPLREDTGEDTKPLKSPCPPQDTLSDDPGSHAPSEVFPGMTLEQIIDMTGEFAHLNELIMIHIEKTGGFAGVDAYFRTVQPLLDLLEIEIRVRCSSGITQQQMKLVVQDWIDQEIKACGDGIAPWGL